MASIARHRADQHGQRTVGGAHGPAVVIGADRGRAGVGHRLDGERHAPRGSGALGEILGDIACRAMYAALAERRDAVRDSYPALFDGVYLHIQSYRFEPPEPGPVDAARA